MYAWSTKWYTTNNMGETVEHTSSVGEYNHTDTYAFGTTTYYAKATGLVMHPTEPYAYVSGFRLRNTLCKRTPHGRLEYDGRGKSTPVLLIVCYIFNGDSRVGKYHR